MNRWKERETTDEGITFRGPAQDGDDVPVLAQPLGERLVTDPGFQQRFPGEVEALQGLDEPWLAVPTAVVVDVSGYVKAVICRTAGGARLAALIEQYPNGLDAQTTAAIAMDVLSALSALHERRVAHRGDLAEHIVIADDGTCVMVDVGLVPRAQSEGLYDAIAADLSAFTQLLTVCVYGQSTGRRFSAFTPRGSRRAGEAPEPLRALLDQAAAAKPGPQAAAALLAELGVLVAQQFPGDWETRVRERLARASRSPADARLPERDARPAGAARPRVVTLPRVLGGAAVLGALAGLLVAFVSLHSNAPSAGSASATYVPVNVAPSTPSASTAAAIVAVTPSASTSPSPSARTSSAAPSLSATAASSAPGTPSLPAPVSYEADADANILAGGAKVATCTGCPDGEKIRFIGQGGTLTFPDVSTTVAGSYTLVITYVDGDSGRDATVTVDGTAMFIHFPGTGDGDWDNSQTLSVTVRLSSGQNSVEFSNPNTFGPDIAAITV